MIDDRISSCIVLLNHRAHKGNCTGTPINAKKVYTINIPSGLPACRQAGVQVPIGGIAHES